MQRWKTWILQYFIFMNLLLFTDQIQDYDEWEQSYDKIFNRLLKNMRTYAEEASVRYAEMKKYRSSYERSAHFEMGYVMSEIIERYRKMVHSLKGPLDPKARSNSLFINIKRLEYVQKLFLEIYHLVNMMHEINRKYKKMLKKERDLMMAGQVDRSKVQEAYDRLKWNMIMRERERRKKRKMLQKHKMLIIHGQTTKPANSTRNKWWPIDYGWEIDYYW